MAWAKKIAISGRNQKIGIFGRPSPLLWRGGWFQVGLSHRAFFGFLGGYFLGFWLLFVHPPFFCLAKARFSKWPFEL